MINPIENELALVLDVRWHARSIGKLKIAILLIALKQPYPK
jgi:hypothetical protein